ncbi:MAG TPA: putative quinol monooxygenase [Dongiaceae bacterium]|nr:putative quinol monooxygenase [Dongiaceae bacterium]
MPIRISTALAASLMVAGLAGAAPAGAREAAGIRYADIPDGAYSIVAEVRAQPGKEAELRAASLPLIGLVRSDPQNLVYFLQEDRAAPGHFIFFEVFASQADFEAHNAKPYVKAWLARLPELAQGGVEVMRLEVLGKARH